MQRSAGNAAVGGLLAGAPAVAASEVGPAVVQRLAGAPGSIPPPPVPPRPPVPTRHPGFKTTQAKLSAARRGLIAHTAAKAKVDEASRAAKPPADDKEAQAKAAKAGEMGAAPTPGFDKAAFIAAVSAAIAKQAPRNLDEADKFASSGKSDAVAAEVKGKVSQGKESSAKPMADASAKPPDTSKAKEKPVAELPPAQPAPTPPAVDAGAAMPSKAPAEQTNLGSGPAETNQKMAGAGVTEEQLAKSNEPELTGALAAKKEGEAHSAAAPAAFRQGETQQLTTAQQSAQGAGAQASAAMVAARATGLQQVSGGQQQARSADEQKRAEVAAKIKSIFDTTKTEVDGILNGLDAQVDKAFTDGERAAKAVFTADVKARVDKYKDDRYSGVAGWARWTRDLFLSLPPEVNELYQKSRKLYEDEMAKVISNIADLIGRELTRAKERVAKGRQEITTYVDSLDPALKSVGQQAAKDIGSQFDTLTESIDEKSQSLAEDLAEKYVTARQAVDDEVTKMQEENKGLWDKAKDAVGGAIETILKLKNMLMGVLARAAGAVEKIIKDPIGFLGNFVNAIKTGVMNFGSNILEHLKKGLQSWLFGALAEAGIEIPATFDLKGIVGLILSLLGLTWASIRARLAKVLPEWVITALEKAVEVVQILTTEGVGGLWKWVVTKISDLKEQVMSQIRDFVITKVITAGITWLISLLNPAAAFIKACKMIYDAVMWFVDNAQRLGDFVSSVLDSVESIASGGVGRVAALIEATLGKAVPMVISGLASLLGLGGIADKIKKILETIQKPVGKVVDSIIGGVIKYGKKLLGRDKRRTKPGDQPPGAAGNVKPIAKTFGMKGAGHTVSIAAGPPFDLKMASASPGRLVSRIDGAAERLAKKQPRPDAQLGRLREIRELAVTIEKTGERAERGDNDAAKRLEGQLTELSGKIAAYGAEFKATDLDDVDPTNDLELTLRQVQEIGNQKRLAAIDLAIIRLQIERLLGSAWKEFAGTLTAKVWTLSRASLVAVYGRDLAEKMINSPNNPLDGKGLYDPRNNMIFVQTGRSLSEVASSIVHEGTHFLQTEHGLDLTRFEKEFQAFSAQRDFLMRLPDEAKARLPENYQQLLRAASDDTLRQLVQGRYPQFKSVDGLKQRVDVKFIRNLVRKEFGS